MPSVNIHNCPNDSASTAIYMKNIRDKLELYAPIGKLGTQEIEEGKADTNFLYWMHQVWYPTTNDYLQTVRNIMKLAASGSGTAEITIPPPPTFADAPASRPPGCHNRINGYLSRIKAGPDYSDDTVGRDLNIVPPPATVIDHSNPDYELDFLQGPIHKFVRILFKKYRHEAVYIESRYFGEPWEFLAIDSAKPHLDERPLRNPNVPEIREYRMRWWDRGVAHGEWSPVKSITVLP